MARSLSLNFKLKPTSNVITKTNKKNKSRNKQLGLAMRTISLSIKNADILTPAVKVLKPWFVGIAYTEYVNPKLKCGQRSSTKRAGATSTAFKIFWDILNFKIKVKIAEGCCFSRNKA